MVAVLFNVAVWQISTWLSALRQPAHRNAAAKCHTPSLAGFLPFGSQHKVIGWPRPPRPSPNRKQPHAVVHGLAFSKVGSELGPLQESSVKRAGYSPAGCVLARYMRIRQNLCNSSQGSAGVPRSNIYLQSKVCLFSLAVPSRTSLTFRSSRHLQASLVGSLRAAHSGAAYLGR